MNIRSISTVWKFILKDSISHLFYEFFSTWFFVRCCWKVARVSISDLIEIYFFFWGLVSWTFVSTLEWDDQFRGTFDWKWIFCCVVKELNDSKGFLERFWWIFERYSSEIKVIVLKQRNVGLWNGFVEKLMEIGGHFLTKFMLCFKKGVCWWLKIWCKIKTCFDMIEQDLKTAWLFLKPLLEISYDLRWV